MSDKEVQLSSLRGKVILLNFWTTWCGPCRQEIPALEKIHRENKDVAVLAVNVGEDIEKVRAFAQDNRITYSVLLAGNGRVVTDYAVNGFPTAYIVDKQRIVRWHRVGYLPGHDQELDTNIAAARQPRAPAAPSPPKIDTPVYSGSVEKIGPDVSPPVVLSKQEPLYTEEARRSRISGAVLLELVVTPDGRTASIKVLRGLGYGLDESAIATVSKWKFRPGTKEGRPVAVLTRIETQFRLLDGPPIRSSTAADPTMEASGEPQTAEEAYRRATVLARNRRTEEAISMFGKAIELKPDWALAYVSRGRARYEAKLYNEAIQDFDEAIRIGPALGHWYGARGLAYSYSGQHARAIKDYTRAIELNQEAAGHYNDRGWAYKELGELDKAVEDLSKAITLAPNHLKAYENRGLTYEKQKNYSGAVADYTAAIQLHPTAWQYQRRAEAKRALGDSAGAEEDLRRASQLAATSHAGH